MTARQISFGSYSPGDIAGIKQPNAWFNLLPPLVAEKPLSAYTTNVIAGANAQQNSQIVPFPGGVGKIYKCTAAQMMGNDFATIDASSPPHGADGFFSYDMNIDLKHNKPAIFPNLLYLLYLSPNAQNNSNKKASGNSFYVRLLLSAQALKMMCPRRLQFRQSGQPLAQFCFPA